MDREIFVRTYAWRLSDYSKPKTIGGVWEQQGLEKPVHKRG